MSSASTPRRRSTKKTAPASPSSPRRKPTEAPVEAPASPKAQPAKPDVVDVPVVDNERGNWQKWRTRTISTLLMLFGFIFLIFLGHIALWCLIIFVQTMMFREIVTLGKLVSRERQAPEQNGLQWYWFIVSMLVMNSRSLERHFQSMPFVNASIFKYHAIVCFLLYMAGLVKFVTSLRKGLMKYQFIQFAWCHLTLVVVVFTSHFAIVNLFQGLIWMILPSLLIIANDVFAYIFGFFFGRRFFQRGLIELSPKKTWEGFIGATIVTFGFGFVLSRLFGSFAMFVCPKTDFTFGFADCVIEPHFIPADYALPMVLQSAFKLIGLSFTSISVSPIQIHGMVFAAFASIIAPFGGFFASGFKRAFKVKDFGDSIPGHGGMTDRMDCQILLGFFVNVYFDTFITGSGFLLRRTVMATPAAIVAAFQQLSETQRVEVLARLQGLIQ